MGGKNPRVVYWDTNVFISLYGGSATRTAEEWRGIEYWRDLADVGDATIVTSTLTYAEVLECHMSEDDYQKFHLFMSSYSVEVKDATLGVMRKAKELREHFMVQRRKGGELNLCTPDAIHVATAVIFECTEFHTFDARNKRGCHGLLRLGTLPKSLGIMRFCKPAAPPTPVPLQPTFFDDQAESEVGDHTGDCDGGTTQLSLPATAGAEAGDGQERLALPKGSAESDAGFARAEGLALAAGAEEAMKALPPGSDKGDLARPELLQLGAGSGPLGPTNADPARDEPGERQP
jgi:predicted nucleic acid-binding protein